MSSVTTIIKGNCGWSSDVLFYWGIKMMKQGKDPLKVRDQAAELGTLIHAYIEAEIYGHKVDIETMEKFDFDDIAIAENCLRRYRELKEEHCIEWLESELPLVSEKYQYGGCLDGICNLRWKDRVVLALADTKSSNGIYADQFVQLGAYKNLIYENTKYRPHDFFIIKCSKDKETILKEDQNERVKLIKIPERIIDLGFEVFKSLLVMKEAKKEIDTFLKELK